jgi:methyl-accepting chemotaxis protein
MRPEDVTSHHDCEFGKWYYSTSGQTLSGITGFAEVGEQHEQVHKIAREIVASYGKGDTSRAQALMAEFEKVRKKLFETLDILYRA